MNTNNILKTKINIDIEMEKTDIFCDITTIRISALSENKKFRMTREIQSFDFLPDEVKKEIIKKDIFSVISTLFDSYSGDDSL